MFGIFSPRIWLGCFCCCCWKKILFFSQSLGSQTKKKSKVNKVRRRRRVRAGKGQQPWSVGGRPRHPWERDREKDVCVCRCGISAQPSNRTRKKFKRKKEKRERERKKGRSTYNKQTKERKLPVTSPRQRHVRQWWMIAALATPKRPRELFFLLLLPSSYSLCIALDEDAICDLLYAEQTPPFPANPPRIFPPHSPSDVPYWFITDRSVARVGGIWWWGASVVERRVHQHP